jgi:polysaccharide deacetylase 2 family uncharacterized protein YibQ
MAKQPPAAPVPTRPVSYRALGIFWAVVLVFLAAAAGTLQALGPLKPAAPAAPQAPAAAPAPAPPRPEPPKPKPLAGIPAPDSELLDPAPDYPGRYLPEIGRDGREPSRVYASQAYDKNAKPPFLSLVVVGGGLDQALTEQTLRDLPGAVDIAFSAYMPGRDDEDAEKAMTDHVRAAAMHVDPPPPVRADALAELARTLGHECLQSIPMEPNLAGNSADEGPKALMTSASDETIKQYLAWSLSRLGGCIGATGASDGFTGDRFAQTSPNFSLVLEQAADRGLLYLDPRTGAPLLAVETSSNNVRVADVIIDQPQNPERPEDPAPPDVIDRRLDDLVAKAKLNGSAIGLAGPPTPMLLAKLREFTSGLSGRGVTLVPLTALPAPPPPTPAAEAPADTVKAADTPK